MSKQRRDVQKGEVLKSKTPVLSHLGGPPRPGPPPKAGS